MSFTYRGTTSDSMHFNVTERQVYNAPAFDVNTIEVPGRSGDVLNSQNRFKNKTIVYTGFLREQDFPGDSKRARLSRGLRNLKAWICGDPGKYHDLTDDYDPGYIRRAFVSGETTINEILDQPDGVTITVAFYAEPFMYEVTEPIEVPEGETVGPADIATFQGVVAPLQSLIFGIEPQQNLNGFEYPWPGGGSTNKFNAESTTDLVGLSRSGETFTNTLTDTKAIQIIAQAYNGTTYLASSGTFTSKEGGRYGTSFNVPANTTRIKIKHNGQQQDLSFFVPWTVTGTIYISAALPSMNPSTVGGLVIKDVMIALSETYSPYSPYANICPISGWTQCDGKQSGADTSDYENITVQLGQTLYGGEVDVLSGVLTIDRVLLDLGTLGYSGSGSGDSKFFQSTAISGIKSSTQNIICTQYKYAAIASANTVEGINVNGDRIRIRDHAYKEATGAEFKTAMSGVNAVYELASPTTVQLTAQQVSSLLGTNNIWCNTGQTTVTYNEPTENPTEWPSKPLLEITMSGAGTLTINGKTWTIGAYTGTLYCDPDIMDWYDAGALKNSLVSGDGFPEFLPGENVITYTGGITKVVATPRWRTL